MGSEICIRDRASAEQLVEYLARARQTLGALPSQDTLLMERFFVESGGTQLIIHSPFGSRFIRASRCRSHHSSAGQPGVKLPRST